MGFSLPHRSGIHSSTAAGAVQYPKLQRRTLLLKAQLTSSPPKPLPETEKAVSCCLGIREPTMSSDDRTNPLTESSMTIPSDSEQYSGNDELSPSPPSSSSSRPIILYSPPSLWGIIRGAAINLLLPFINGLMLGFGELFAHEAAFRLGWGGTKVNPLPTLVSCHSSICEGWGASGRWNGNLDRLGGFSLRRRLSSNCTRLTHLLPGLPTFASITSSRTRS